jgi:hypothetical protein
LAPTALARPVSYPGGTMAMLEADDDAAMAEIVHTITPRTGIGLHAEWNEAQDWQAQMLMGSVLVARDNQKQSQANVFAMLGVGVASADVASWGADQAPTLLGVLEADWETRRLYVQAKVRARYVDDAVQNGDPTGLDWRVRAGFAPVLAPAGGLQPWLIAQLDHDPDAPDPLTPRAVLRLFSGPVLMEAGLTDRGAANAALWFYF